MVDSVYRTRSLGVAAQGIPDQYADGKAARVWEFYIGSRTERTDSYRHFLGDLLRSRNCNEILDVACGTGQVSSLRQPWNAVARAQPHSPAPAPKSPEA